MNGAEKALATLRDYVERSTHWQEGGATRHDAMVALATLGMDMPKPYMRAALIAARDAWGQPEFPSVIVNAALAKDTPEP